MSPLSLRVPQYRHQKSRDLAVVRINGKDFYLGKYNSPESHAQYKRLIGEWLARGQEPELAPEEPKSVAEIMVAYLKHAHGYYRTNVSVSQNAIQRPIDSRTRSSAHQCKAEHRREESEFF